MTPNHLVGVVVYTNPKSPYISVRVTMPDYDVPLSLKAKKTHHESVGDVVKVVQTTGGYKGWKVEQVYEPKPNGDKTMSNESNKFWMVWREGDRAPSMKHPTYEDAQAEAERLARQNPRHRFYVLRAVSVSECNSVQTTNLD